MLLTLAGLIGQLSSGTHVGVYNSVFIWLTFIATLVFAAYEILIILVRAAGRNRQGKGPAPLLVGVPALVICAVSLVVVQAEFHGVSYIVGGVEAGEAPLSLLAFSSIITALIGVLIFADVRLWEGWSYRMTGQNHSGESYPDTRAGIRADFSGARRIGEIDWASQKPADESKEMRVVLDSIEGNHVVARVQIGKRGPIRFDKDFLQARNNIEQWIIFRLETLGPVTKSRLEREFGKVFSEQFTSLFDSVLYDMLYREKLLMGNEGQTVVIGLPAGRETPTPSL
ncbi:MAG: hypothetical protein JRN68_01825 [Nitrososphaerota archaeon]|nr:hypothetical protein [Nitrososphaerota archaeon]